MKLQYNSITAKASHSLRPGQKLVKRDDVAFLEGRVFGATGQPFTGRLSKRLAGSQSEAQPPGAWMAVREKTVTRCAPRVKPYPTTCGCFVSAARTLAMPDVSSLLGGWQAPFQVLVVPGEGAGPRDR